MSYNAFSPKVKTGKGLDILFNSVCNGLVILTFIFDLPFRETSRINLAKKRFVEYINLEFPASSIILHAKA